MLKTVREWPFFVPCLYSTNITSQQVDGTIFRNFFIMNNHFILPVVLNATFLEAYRRYKFRQLLLYFAVRFNNSENARFKNNTKYYIRQR